MDRLPLGIERLDQIIGGGAPRGSVVLLAGDSGAGAREFCYTSSVVNGLGLAEDELFDLHYGDLSDDAELPAEIHYVSFTDDRSVVHDEMAVVMEQDLVSHGMAEVSFHELSQEYFQMTPVPREWYAGSPGDINSLGEHTSRSDILASFASYLTEHAARNLVIVDSVTDLIVSQESSNIRDLTVLLKGLARASHRWGGLILLLVNTDVLSETQYGRLKEATDGTLRFAWESGGSERDRTLVVEQFRGVLSRLEDENVIQFETEIHDSGFDISNVRKIR